MRQVFYYKMRQLLQIATILLQNVTVITKCDVYYKLRQCRHLFNYIPAQKHGKPYMRSNEISKMFVITADKDHL